jgi:hypothetical protein
MRIWAIVASMVIIPSSVASGAPIAVGGFTFSEGEVAFADDASLVSGSVRFSCTAGGTAASSISEALSGSDVTQCVNTVGGGDGTVEVLFTDNSITNGPGTDLVIFEVSGFQSVGTPDPNERFEVSIFDGATYSGFASYDPVSTGYGTLDPSLYIFAVEIDLSDFGLAAGAITDRVRVHLFDVGGGSKAADIAALGALNSGAPVPEPSSGALVLLGLALLCHGSRSRLTRR